MAVKRQVAVALGYDKGKDKAPRLLAKGRGFIAQKILELAREHNIPIKEDTDLVRILEKLQVRQEIPPETYVAVAEILAFIYKMNDKYNKLKQEG